MVFGRDAILSRAGSSDKAETIGERFARCGVSRRDFVIFCGKLMVAAPFGLALTDRARAAEVARQVAKARRLPVIWLHFQDCTGCTETLLRTSEPGLADGHRARAAALLGLTRFQLYTRLKRYQIEVVSDWPTALSADSRRPA